MKLLRLAPYIAILLLAAGTAWWLYDHGGEVERGRQATRTIERQKDITDADARGPRTPDDVDRRLRDGTF
jgi:hypothetical protein